MAENKKWSQKELVNSWTNAARICILDGAPLVEIQIQQY